MPGDFTFSGIPGEITFEDGSLDFIPAVPEPAEGWPVVVGGLVMVAAARRRRRV